MQQQLWQQTRGNGLVVSASIRVMQGNGGEAVMAAADERRWQTKAEARTMAADQRGGNGG
jgi:hypothetical protein